MSLDQIIPRFPSNRKKLSHPLQHFPPTAPQSHSRFPALLLADEYRPSPPPLHPQSSISLNSPAVVEASFATLANPASPLEQSADRSSYHRWVCAHIHMHGTGIGTHMHICMHTHTGMHTQGTHAQVHAHTGAHTGTLICMRTRTHPHSHAHTYRSG